MKKLVSTILLTVLVLLFHHVQHGTSLAAGRGRGPRRGPSRKIPAAVQFNTATTTTLDPEDQRDLEILWGMAGQTSRRKQLKKIKINGSRRIRNSRQATITAAGRIMKKADSTIPAITNQEIDDITIDSPTQVTITLTNGTTYTTNPRDYDQRRDFDVWMKTRQQLDISASELSALVNHSVFTTREQLLAKKAGLRPRRQSFVGNSKACQWGIKMEPLALQQYCQVTGNNVEETGLWILKQQQSQSQSKQSDTDTNPSSSFLWLGASPDGIVYDTTTNTTGVLEIKCLWGRRHKRELKPFECCPTRFYDQIQGQLAVTGVSWCDLMLYIPPSSRHARNYCILRVQRNQEYWDETILPAITQFCSDVKTLKEKKKEKEKEMK